VRRLADKVATEQRVNLAHFNPPTVRFDAIGCKWSVSYDMAGPSPIVDSGFHVLVNDVTGALETHGEP
jgi:hypothetical protein